MRAKGTKIPPTTHSDSIRVLHISDTLGGGGIERLIWDLVRLSDPQRVTHRVVTFFPDGYFGPFVYADRLHRAGAYRGPAENGTIRAALSEPTQSTTGPHDAKSGAAQEVSKLSAVSVWRTKASFFRRSLSKLPPSCKRFCASVYQRVLNTVRAASVALGLYFPATYRILREYFRFRPDIVHVHGFYPFMFGVFFKLFFRCVTVHSVPAMFSQMTDQGTGWLPNLYRKFHGRIDRFFLVDAYREQLLGVGVPAEKLFSMRGGVDVREAAKVKSESARYRAEARNRLGIPQDALIALSIGRLHTSKGHQYALEALPYLLTRFPNLHWVVLGEGEMRHELETRREELGLSRHAHIVGHVEDPLPFCAAADVFLRTTVFEGDNLSSYSALAVGLPTVGFETGCELDFIPRVGHGFLAPNRDAVKLAALVEKILSLPDRGRGMGALGIDFCATHLDIRSDVETFVSAYLTLRNLNKKSRSSAPTQPNGVLS